MSRSEGLFRELKCMMATIWSRPQTDQIGLDLGYGRAFGFKIPVANHRVRKSTRITPLLLLGISPFLINHMYLTATGIRE